MTWAWAGAPGGGARAEAPRKAAEPQVSAATRKQVIDGALARLREAYVFPDVAEKMAQAVKARQARKEYDGITSADQLCERLTADLRAVSKDGHLQVVYSSRVLPPDNANGKETPEERQMHLARSRQLNFGFERVERLAGNIGYLDLRFFDDPELGGETAAAALGFLANSDALIIDLRRNEGGEPAMIALITTYLFAGEPVHLNDIYWRPDNSTHQWWTLPHVPGRRLSGKDVYVLTSRETFSGGEEFAYNLKNLRRATLLGEVTGGGAHPAVPRRINDHFGIVVPSGRAINPITRTNWEGTGVKPDIEMPAEQALKSAHLMALRKVLAGERDERRKERLAKTIETVSVELDALKKAPKAPPAP
jgi:hypothetical protein